MFLKAGLSPTIQDVPDSRRPAMFLRLLHKMEEVLDKPAVPDLDVGAGGGQRVPLLYLAGSHTLATGTLADVPDSQASQCS